jgi:hypothetical protein
MPDHFKPPRPNTRVSKWTIAQPGVYGLWIEQEPVPVALHRVKREAGVSAPLVDHAGADAVPVSELH